jgi:hypothetical protein
MNPLEPQEPHFLIQFAVTLAFAIFFAALVLGCCH